MKEKFLEQSETLGNVTLTSVGHVEIDGRVIERDLMFNWKGKDYVLSVGTKEYLERFRKFRPDYNEDEGIMELEEVNDIEKIAKKLKEASIRFLTPFLVEQTPSDDVIDPYIKTKL